MSWRFTAALIAIALPVSASWAQPTLEYDTAGHLVLTTLPALLGDAEVEPELHKGLTTTFVIRVEGRGKKLAGGARIELRYELWDENFRVTVIDLNEEPRAFTLDGDEALREWWSQLRLYVADADTLADERRQMQISLNVLPFSRAEELDTQRWFSESPQRADHDGSGGTAHAPAGESSSMERVFSLLIATSIRRRSLTSYHWSIDLPGSRAP